MSQRPYLNLGCGTIILPRAKPEHHALLPDALYEYPLWENVDRNQTPGVDKVVDLFRYPWPLESDAYDGALLSHLCEHIPHEVNFSSAVPAPDFSGWDGAFGKWQRDYERVAHLQDGWFAFFAELYRVLTPGARVHILSPYAWTHAAMSDPTHTRYLTESVFMHSMMPDEGAAFHYATGGIKFRMVRGPVYRVTPKWVHLMGDAQAFDEALHTHLNVVYDFAIEMECVK